MQNTKVSPFALLVLFVAMIAFTVFTAMTFGCGDDDDDDDSYEEEYYDDDDSNYEKTEDEGEDYINIGFARTEITPDHSVILGGYNLPSLFIDDCRWSTGTHDPLYAYAVVFEDLKGVEPVILITLDLVGIPSPDARRIRIGVAEALELAPNSVIVCANHTHSGPDTIGLWGALMPITTGRDEQWIDYMIDQAIDAAELAWEDREPGYIRYAVGEDKEYHESRINFDPIVTTDDTMTLIIAHRFTGEVKGTLLNWTSHLTLMGPQNTEFTADWAWAYRTRMESELGGLHVFINGAIGDAVEPRNPEFTNPTIIQLKPPFVGWGSWESVENYGQHVFEDAMGLYKKAKRLEEQSLWMNETAVYTIKLENILFYLMGQTGLIPWDNVPPMGGDLTNTISAFALGEVVFGTMPGEFATDYAFELRELFGWKAQFIIGLAQDWFGYTITPRQYEYLLAYYYQVILCPSKMAGENMMEAYYEMFDSIYAQ